jgi:hypothetical protein
MKKVLFICFVLLLAAHYAHCQTTNLTFQTWPRDSVSFQNPGRGVITRHSVAAWDNSAPNGVQAPTGATVGKAYAMRLNLYNTQFGNGSSPTNWTWAINSPNDWQGFDWGFKWAIDRNMLVCLAITDIVDGYDPYNGPSGANLSYPTHLHDSLQQSSAASGLRDTIIGGNWVPNWNNEVYLRFYERLLDTFSRWINNSTYSGVPYSKVVQYLDIRSFGNTGEWHNAGTGFSTLKSTNRLPTVATYKRMVNAYTTYFPNTELIYIMNAFDDDGSSEIPAEVVSYILDSAYNNYGPIGFGYRRDNWGQSTFDGILLNSNYNYSGSLRTKIRDIWKKGRITGEPSIDGANVTYNGGQYYRMAIEADSFHMSMLENGNWASYSTQMGDTIRLAEKRMGYKYALTAGSMPTTPTVNQNAAVSITWHNLGVAPMYDRRFKIRYRLRSSGGTLLQTLNSSLQLYLQHNDTTHVDQLQFNQTCTGCKLEIVVIDSLGYITAPIKLSITQPAQNGDGSYTLRSSFNIQDAGVLPGKIRLRKL